MTTPSLAIQTNGAAETTPAPDALQDILADVPAGAAPEPSLEVAAEPPRTPDAIGTPEVDALTRREQEIGRREQEFAQQQRVDRVQKRVLDYYQQKVREYTPTYEQQGFDSAQAQAAADRDARKDAQLGWQQYQHKMVLERLVAREEGVPIEVLESHWDETAMRQEAARYKRSGGPQNEELTAVKRQLAELQEQFRKAQVPAQPFNQPGSPGRPRVTTENLEVLYNAWDRAHPNQQGNPYEEQLRRVMNGG